MNVKELLESKSTEVKDFYAEKHRPVTKVAEHFGVSRNTMLKALTKLGIDINAASNRGYLSNFLKSRGVRTSQIVEETGISYNYLLRMFKGQTSSKLKQALKIVQVLDLRDSYVDLLHKFSNDAKNMRPEIKQILMAKGHNLPRVNSELTTLSNLTGVSYSTLVKNFNNDSTMSLNTALKILDVLYSSVDSVAVSLLREMDKEQ
jgi:DNA-binding phage protein